ncbi:MAG TPA: hypothetical protein VFN10_01940 [Thermoanaerobaculia bacterium]|nr:hypothetical protein [Thermoanaerobaculia bacterium]
MVDWQTLPEVQICSRLEVGRLLESLASPEDLALFVSIGDPDDPLPDGYDRIVEPLRLHFLDADDDRGASEEDILRIIAAGRELRSGTARVVLHCWEGISRSTAAAIILLASAMGRGHESDVVSRIFSLRAVARPNQRMIRLADALLQCDGALIHAIEAHGVRTHLD